MTIEIGTNSAPIVMKRLGLPRYMRADADRIWPRPRLRATWNGWEGCRCIRSAFQISSTITARMARKTAGTAAHGHREQVRSGRHPGAEHIGGARVAGHAARHRERRRVPARLRPRDRMVPLRVHVRAGGPVVERGVLLAPVARVGQPRILRRDLGRVVRHQLDGGAKDPPWAARVVAADAGRAARAQVERRLVVVGVRPLGRIHDRMGAVHLLQLGGVPGGPLGPVVLAVADLGRGDVQGGGGGRAPGSRAGSSPSRPRACC